MSGKMEEKMKGILRYSGRLGSGGIKNPGQTVSPVVQAICELARHIDDVEKQKEDDEFTSEADKEADLPSPFTYAGIKREADLLSKKSEEQLRDQFRGFRGTGQSQDTLPTPEPDNEADLPVIVSGTGGKLPKEEQKPVKKPWLVDQDSRKEEEYPTPQSGTGGKLKIIQHPEFPGNPKS